MYKLTTFVPQAKGTPITETVQFIEKTVTSKHAQGTHDYMNIFPPLIYCQLLQVPPPNWGFCHGLLPLWTKNTCCLSVIGRSS